MSTDIQTRSDYLLSRILARLGIMGRVETQIVAPRFRVPTGPSNRGFTFKSTIQSVGAAAGKFLNQNSMRFALLLSQQSGGQCRVWTDGTFSASGGFIVPSNGYLEFVRDRHGDLVGSDWWVVNPLGATNFSFVEIY